MFVFSFANKVYGLEVARTMTFVCLGMTEMIHSFNIRSEESIFKIGLFSNKYLLRSIFTWNYYASWHCIYSRSKSNI